MNFLLSMNQKFFNVPVPSVVSTWKKWDMLSVIDGAELYVNTSDQNEKKYVKQLAQEFKNNNWILQIHGPNAEVIARREIVDYYQELAELTNKPLHITFHGFSSKGSKKDNILYTKDMAETLKELSKGSNLNFSIENLNAMNNAGRLNKNDVEHVLIQSDFLGFCWDIGHEVDDNTCDYKLRPFFKKRLKNVHIHDIGVSDHYPFDFDKTDAKRVFEYLKTINYNGNVVFEIALDYLKGNNFEEKQIAYIEQLERFRFYRSGFFSKK